MSARGAIICVLATGLANAVREDEKDPAGFDISAGIFGIAVSNWIRKVADEFLEAADLRHLS